MTIKFLLESSLTSGCESSNNNIIIWLMDSAIKLM